MSVYWDKGKGRWRFDYQGRVAGRRIRATKCLPPGWTRQQAEAYARAEVARLFTVGEHHVTVDRCVALYIDARAGTKSYRKAAEHLAH